MRGVRQAAEHIPPYSWLAWMSECARKEGRKEWRREEVKVSSK